MILSHLVIYYVILIPRSYSISKFGQKMSDVFDLKIDLFLVLRKRIYLKS